MKNQKDFRTQIVAVVLVLFFTFCISSISPAVLDSDEGSPRSISARVDALGGAFVGDAGDISAMRYNSAGLMQVKGQNVIATHQKIWGNLAQFTYFGIGTPLSGDSHLGVSYSIFEPSEEELYSAKEQRLSLSYAALFSKNMLGGVTFRYITVKDKWDAGSASGNGYGFDVGWIYRFSDTLQFGVAIYDLASKMSYSGRQGSDTFETRMTVGMRLSLDKNTRIFCDIKDPVVFNNAVPKRLPADPKIKTTLSLGFEKYLDEAVAVRLGYNGGKRAFAAGVGIVIGPWNIDYAYAPSKEGESAPLGFEKEDAHKISLMMKLR